jgi:DEAD/DEAH box helicase domain-containing protein
MRSLSAAPRQNSAPGSLPSSGTTIISLAVDKKREEESSVKKESEAAVDANLVFLDIETQFLADEVGGWGNKAAMKVSVAVTYSSAEKKFRQYTETQVPQLIEQLKGASKVVGFNLKNFDYGVLQAYTSLNLMALPTLDMLEEVTRALGHRLKLETLATATLNAAKGADGFQAVAWWREGKLAELLKYCQKDVEITRDLWEFGKRYGYLLYEDRGKGLLRVPVAW